MPIPKRPGKVMCLGGCNKEFQSKDKATNRICPSCSRKSGRDRETRVHKVAEGGHNLRE